MYFFYDSLLSCLNCFAWEMYFPGTHIKNFCLKFVLFQASNWRWEVNRKSFVVPFYTSFFCLWEVTIAVVHGGTSIENTFKYIASRLLCDFKSQSYCRTVLSTSSTATTPSPYTHANDVHVRACARYESKPTSIVPSYCFFFVPRAIHVNFRVFWDMTQDSIRSCTHARFVTRGTL